MDNLTNEREFRENTIKSLARLETDMNHVKEDISDMKSDISRMEDSISNIKDSVSNIEKWMTKMDERSEGKEKSSVKKRSDLALGLSAISMVIAFLGQILFRIFGG